MTKHPKLLNKYIRKEVQPDLQEHVDNVDTDNDMTDIPEFWKYVGKCSFKYRMKLGTETYSKCLVCSRNIGNDKTNFARHWRRYHLENNVNSTVKKSGNLSRKTLYFQRTFSPRNELNDIPKFWDEYIGKSQKEGDRYKCKICGSVMSTDSKLLKKHWRKFHSDAPEDQVIIVKEGENPDDVIASLMEDKLIPGKGLRSTCTICGLSQPKSDLVRHIDSNHIKGAKYKCGDCSNVAKCKRAHEIHLRTCIKKIAKKVPEKLRVQMSNFDFKLKMKSMIGRNESEYICKECGVSKTSNVSIQRHVESSHMEVDHLCTLCESKVWFKDSRNLTRHIKRHYK